MNDKITTQFCDKTMSGDFNTEVSLPDYEPEIRRLLKVGARLAPPSGFYDGSRVGVSGRIIYDILYAGGDGELYSTSAEESYELAEATKPSEKCSDRPIILCEVRPESLISRVVAPRKLSLKCRISGRARGFCENELAENSTYVENPSAIKRLTGESAYLRIIAPSLCEIKVSDDINAEGGDVRIISYDAAAIAEEAEPSNGRAVVKGVLHISLLAAPAEGGEPFTLRKKIPFAEVVDADGVTPDCSCATSICCTDLDISVEDGHIFCEATLSVELSATEEKLSRYTKDLFSTEVSSNTTEKRLEFPLSQTPISGNFSLSLRKASDEEEWLNGAEIVCSSLGAVVKNIEIDGQKSALVGEAAINLLAKSQNEYITKEFKLPFKYEFDSVCDTPMFSEWRVIPLSPTATIENGRRLCDCELYVSGRIFLKSALTALDEAIFGEPLEKDGEMTVCFPSPTDTAWDISKRYHVPTEVIISQNPSSFDTTLEADESKRPTAPIIIAGKPPLA